MTKSTSARSIWDLSLAVVVVACVWAQPVDTLCEWNSWLEGKYVPLFRGLWPISVLDFCGSAMACGRYRQVAVEGAQRPRSTLEAFFACLLLQFGGTTLTGTLLGQVPSWIMSHTAFNAFILSFFLTFFCPYDLFWHLTRAKGKGNTHTPFLGGLFLVPISVIASISSGHAITSWGVDKAAMNSFHTNSERLGRSVWLCIFAGISSGAGGGFLCDWLGLLREEKEDSYKQLAPTVTPVQGSSALTAAVTAPPAVLTPLRALRAQVNNVEPTNRVEVAHTRDVHHPTLVSLYRVVSLASAYYMLWDPQAYVKDAIQVMLSSTEVVPKTIKVARWGGKAASASAAAAATSSTSWYGGICWDDLGSFMDLWGLGGLASWIPETKGWVQQGCNACFVGREKARLFVCVFAVLYALVSPHFAVFGLKDPFVAVFRTITPTIRYNNYINDNDNDNNDDNDSNDNDMDIDTRG